MRFFRRDRPTQGFTVLRVALFFLAAGLWLAGVRAGNDTVTAIAIVVATVAMLFSLVLRRIEARSDETQEEISDL